MNSPERASRPIGSRELFLTTVVLIGLSVIFPPIAFLTGLLAIAVIASWLLTDIHGFLSVVWRIFLFLLLLAAITFVWASLDKPQAEYSTQSLVAGSIGMVAALSGLVRSFFFKKAENWK
jgi:hypothetical protein